MTNDGYRQAQLRSEIRWTEDRSFSLAQCEDRGSRQASSYVSKRQRRGGCSMQVSYDTANKTVLREAILCRAGM
jgi:hypothetical protein